MTSKASSISIVIPCFNQGGFLAECLESVQKQTRRAAQVIVVDDGSTDPYTISELDRLCVGEVELIRQHNRGLSGARNAGIKKVTSQWVLPLDCDDQLEPNALEAFTAALEEDDTVDIWVPDLQHFGLNEDTWKIPEFNPWRQLAENQLVAGSVIRRSIFDAGYWYDETFRQGYEDWEFYIRATCVGGYRVKPLGFPAFRYRKWGYSMLSSADARSEMLKEQIRLASPALFSIECLDALKREHAPYLVISTALSEDTIRKQSLKDVKRVAPLARDMSDFDGALGGYLVVVFDDEVFASTLEGDQFFLEKVARATYAHRPPVMCLVTVDDAAAYPGRFVVGEFDDGEQQCIGIVISTRFLLDRPEVEDSGRPWYADVMAQAEVFRPGETLKMIAGGYRSGQGGFSVTPSGGDNTRHRKARLASTTREKAFRTAQVLNRAVRNVIGEHVHDKFIKQSDVFQFLKGELGARRRRRVKPWRDARVLGVHRVPVPPDESQTWRARQAAFFVANEPPRFSCASQASDASPGLMILVPWIVQGGADRAVVDLLKGLSRDAPNLRKFLVATLPAKMDWSDRVFPYVDGFFPFPELSSQETSKEIAGLADRLNISAVLIANSQAGFDALPELRRLERRIRIVVQTHGFEVDWTTGELSGHPAYVASRYNNLVDGYANISQFMSESLTREFYVSPAKQRVIYLGVDTDRLRKAYRDNRHVRGELTVLWLGRLSEEKDPLLALEVMARWKRHKRPEHVRLLLAGGGPLEREVHARVASLGLEDMVSVVGPVSDPYELFARADCLMMTSRFEGIPVVAYEAMACGVPLITATKNTAVREVLSADNSYFLEDRSDLSAYVAAFERILDDPEELYRKSRSLLEVSATYSTERYVLETLEFLFPGQTQRLRNAA